MYGDEDSDEWSFTLEQITPDQAVDWLKKNKRNRSVSRTTVEKYRQDIVSGRWHDRTAEPIKIATDGRLLDGQHRLLACVSAGVPIRATVCRGVPLDAMPYLDSGKARDAGDALQLMGYLNSHQLASAAAVLIRIKAGVLRRNSIPKAEIIDVVLKHPDLHESASLCSSIKASVPPSLLSAIHYTGHLTRQEKHADAFVEVFRTGVPRGSNDDPAFAWRERVIRSKVTKGKNMILAREAMFKGTIHAFNLSKAGHRMKSRFVIPEHFVAIDGLDVALI